MDDLIGGSKVLTQREIRRASDWNSILLGGIHGLFPNTTHRRPRQHSHCRNICWPSSTTQQSRRPSRPNGGRGNVSPSPGAKTLRRQKIGGIRALTHPSHTHFRSPSRHSAAGQAMSSNICCGTRYPAPWTPSQALQGPPLT